MDPAIRQAITWAVLCVSVVMGVFTWVDIAEGTTSTAMWLNGVAWPVGSAKEPLQLTRSRRLVPPRGEAKRLEGEA